VILVEGKEVGKGQRRVLIRTDVCGGPCRGIGGLTQTCAGSDSLTYLQCRCYNAQRSESVTNSQTMRVKYISLVSVKNETDALQHPVTDVLRCLKIRLEH